MKAYLEESEIINYSHPDIAKLSKKLAIDLSTDRQIAENCFLYVRDQIQHTGDIQSSIPTVKASEVLEHKTGWCYAKSHLLAALLRANNIPTAFCYQRLFCDEYSQDSYCLHGLNAVYLKDFGWYRIDARGNKEGVTAEFQPPHEQLAFKLTQGESDIEGLHAQPLEVVINALTQNYDAMIHNFPDICT